MVIDTMLAQPSLPPFLFDELFELFGERRQDHVEFRD